MQLYVFFATQTRDNEKQLSQDRIIILGSKNVWLNTL